MAEGSSYGISHRTKLDSFHLGLSDNMAMITSLEKGKATAVLAYLLELACQAQSIYNIGLGRNSLMAIPRDWLLERIEQVAEPLIQRDQEYEFRRLLELYELLDAGLLRRVAERGRLSHNREIREAAEDFLEKLECDSA